MTLLPGESGAIAGVSGSFTERYVSAINVKCLLFLFKSPTAILANRIRDRSPAKTLREVDVESSIACVAKNSNKIVKVSLELLADEFRMSGCKPEGDHNESGVQSTGIYEKRRASCARGPGLRDSQADVGVTR
jgi:hypothetical protein